MREVLEKVKPVEKEVREETLEKLEILDTHDENWALANKKEFLGPNFDQYLEELKEQGILKFSPSPGRLKWAKREEERTHRVCVIEPIGDDKGGGYYYGSEQSIHAGAHGDIFRSLPQLREKVIGNEQPRKKRSKERPKRDIELLKHFEKLMSEPLKLLSSLDKKFKQEGVSIDILKNYARQLNRATKNNDYADANALITDLEDMGIVYLGEFNRDMFENTILPEAEKHNLIEKTSENEFPREDVEKAKKEKREVMDQAKWEEIYYQWWDNALGGIFHIDVYTFKGDKNSDNAKKYIFKDLKQCAKIVGDIDWIKSSIDKWEGRRREEEIPETQREADRKATEPSRQSEEQPENKKKTLKEKKDELKKKKKARQETKRDQKEFAEVEGEDYYAKLKTLREQMIEQEKKEKKKLSAKKKITTTKKTRVKKKTTTKKKAKK